MLEMMNELNEIWARQIEKTVADAKNAGRGDVADYLNLRAANDAVRAASVKWLFDSLTEIAAFASRGNISIAIENESPHQFKFAGANMVGALARFRLGVRCLTLEAGWTRTPADGFMRGGALAAARLTHFGMKKYDEEIILLRDEDFPNWFSIGIDGGRTVFNSVNLRRHFEIFTG
jgi:sugar phosphate isomerase/epimerase